MGFRVGLWNWPDHDLAMLERSGATFSIMNGYLRGRLTDDEGADELLKTARETVAGRQAAGRRSGSTSTEPALARAACRSRRCEVVTGAMWLKARDTLNRIADIAEQEGVTFTLENLNLPVDHPGVPFARAEDTLALVSSVDRPGLRLNLDLYHAQIGEGNLIELCRRCLPWIGEIQVADVPGRWSRAPARSTAGYRPGAEGHGLSRPGRHGGLRLRRSRSGTRSLPRGLHGLRRGMVTNTTGRQSPTSAP